VHYTNHEIKTAHQSKNMPALSSSTPSSSVLGLLFLLLVSLSVSSAEVVSLTDQTFEHQTQASTGATTGSWLVLFGVPDCKSCDTLKPLLEELGRDEELYEKGIVLGSVDCSENPGVCFRFGTTKLPVLLYLHKKQMYRYPRDEEFGSLPSQDDLKSFVLGGYSSKSLAETIPDPPSALDAFLKPILQIYDNNPLAGYAIFGMAAMMVSTILVLLVTLVMGGGSSSSGAAKKGKSKSKSYKKNK